MKLKFTKMHGAGNDFIVIDAINQALDLHQIPWKRLADRRFGIGADQILVVQAPPGQNKDNNAGGDDNIDFQYRIFNADGGEVEQCGNGSRAFVKFVVEKGLSLKHCIRVSTLGGVLELTLTDDGQVCVNMGPPRLNPDQVPFDIHGLQGRTEGEDTLWPLTIDADTVWVSVLSMGNPHAVQVVADVDQITIAHCGPLIEHHPRFPQRVNAGFMQVMHRQKIKLRVYERGAGETLACGTGSCASVVAGIRRGLLDSPVAVQARGGELSIAWAGGTAPVFMTGPAVSVFEGEIDL
jgi:diaminopimelate epimerase